MKGTSSSEISRDVVWSCYVLEFLQENEESPWIPQQVVRFHSKRHAMALTARNHLASEIPHQAMLCFELLSIGRAQMQNMKSDVRNMTMWIAKDGKNRKNHSCRINDIITHATCAVFVAFWFPWLQMTKPALSPRIWSNYTVYAREILHTHSWYNINYASIILRGSFALLDMLRAAIWSLCFALSFHSFSSAISLSFPLCDSLCLLQAAAKDAPSLACERKRLSCRHSDRNTANLAFECLAVEPCIVHISWLVMGRTTQIACCDESSDHVRYTVWSLNVGISGWDVIGCRLALKNILSGLPFNYIL